MGESGSHSTIPATCALYCATGRNISPAPATNLRIHRGAAVSPLLLLTLGSLVSFVLGAMLLALAWRGRRIDDHPLCAKCHFDLSGLHNPNICPECGTELRSRSAICRGHWKIRRPSLAAGAILLCASATPLGVATYARAKHQSLISLTPTWWLMRELRSPDIRISLTALTELEARLTSGTLDHAVTSALVDQMLDCQLQTIEAMEDHQRTGDSLQGEDPREILQFWMPAFDAALAAGDVSPSQALHYTKQSLRNAGADVRRRAHAGTWMHFESYACDNMGVSSRRGGLGLRWHLTGADIDGRDVPAESDSDPGDPYWGLLGSCSSGRVLADADPGMHTLTMTWEFEVFLPSNSSTPAGSFRKVQTTPLLLVPQEQPVPLVRSEPQQEMQGVIDRVELVLENDEDPQWLTVSCALRPHRAALVGHVDLCQGSRQWTIGSLSGEDRDYICWTNPRPTDLDTAQSLDLVFVPDAKAAERDTLAEDVWGAAIIVPGLQIRARYKDLESPEQPAIAK
jgi:hypothetical protein